MFFFFKQKTAYEMRISDWSSDVCSSDLGKVLDQFSNPDNPRAHIESTGPELWKQTGGEITHFVSAMGTTGTIMGVSAYLRTKNPAIQVIGAQPAAGAKIPGIRQCSDDYLPSIYHPAQVNEFELILPPEDEQIARPQATEQG